MSNFKQSILSFGPLKQGAVINAVFEVVSDLKITGVTPSCGCTASSYTDKTVTIKYRTKAVPAHLGNEYESVKTAMVFFSGGSMEKVILKVIITNV